MSSVIDRSGFVRTVRARRFDVVAATERFEGGEVVLADGRGRLLRMSVKELLFSDRARVIDDGSGPGSADDDTPAAVVLDQLTDDQRQEVLQRAEHMREVLTGYRSGSAELAQPGKPRAAFDPGLQLESRYAAKAAELGISARTLKRWVARFRGP